MSDRPTPETDEQINGKPCTRFAIYAGDSLRDAMVPSEFARRLERERDEAREDAKRATYDAAQETIKVSTIKSHWIEACRERDEAREKLSDWENAALHVESDHPNEVHCGCVPILRKLLADARKERDEARAKAKAWKESATGHRLNDIITRSQRDYWSRQYSEAKAQVQRIKDGHEGCCYACEPVGELNLELEKTLADIKAKVRRLFEILETVEVSDSEREFHPTRITSCRTQHTIELGELLPKLRAFAFEEGKK